MYFFFCMEIEKTATQWQLPGVEILLLLLVLFSNCAILLTLIMFTFELFENMLLVALHVYLLFINRTSLQYIYSK